jgi:D-alanyl-D-alanine carboxypeptidase (penicillin-binding protein 5/6)
MTGRSTVFAAVMLPVAFLCLAAVMYSAAALVGIAPSVLAATQVSSRTITASFPSGEPIPPSVTATAAILIDAETGKILFSHNANARLPMASTTKIMTAAVVLESLDLDARVTISANAVSTIGSKASLKEGEVLTVEQLLYALLVVSGNDASIALAEATAGSENAFVERMNAKADALGLTNTRFVNPCGLNNKKHFSSAKDLATLTQYALRDPVFSRIVDTIYFSLPPLDPVPPDTRVVLRDFDNQNELLHRVAWVTGVKTGSTPYAKYCLVASGTIEGVSLIAVVLGAQEDETRWKEARSLLEYGFSLYPRTLLVDTGEVVTELDVSDQLGRRVTARPLVARLSKTDVAIGSVRLDRVMITPVRAGDVFGALEFTLGDKRLGSVDLVAAQPIGRPTVKMMLDRWEYLRPPLLRPAG